MAKVKIMPRDEDKLIDAMKMFADALEDIGLQTSSCIFDQNGDMAGNFAIDDDAELRIVITNDGDRKTVEYRYA